MRVLNFFFILLIIIYIPISTLHISHAADTLPSYPSINVRPENDHFNGSLQLPFRESLSNYSGFLIVIGSLGNNARIDFNLTVNHSSTSSVNMSWVYRSTNSEGLTQMILKTSIVPIGSTVKKTFLLESNHTPSHTPIDNEYLSGTIILELTNSTGNATISYSGIVSDRGVIKNASFDLLYYIMGIFFLIYYKIRKRRKPHPL